MMFRYFRLCHVTRLLQVVFVVNCVNMFWGCSDRVWLVWTVFACLGCLRLFRLFFAALGCVGCLGSFGVAFGCSLIC